MFSLLDNVAQAAAPAVNAARQQASTPMNPALADNAIQRMVGGGGGGGAGGALGALAAAGRGAVRRQRGPGGVSGGVRGTHGGREARSAGGMARWHALPA